MIPLGALNDKQRKQFKILIEVCHDHKGKPLYLREILKIAQITSQGLYSLIYSLRMSLDHNGLCDLREALAIFDIEDPSVDQAIKFVERKLSEQPEKPKLEKPLNTVIEQPKLLEIKSDEPTRKKSLNAKQLACFAVAEILSEFQKSEQQEILKASERVIELGGK